MITIRVSASSSGTWPSATCVSPGPSRSKKPGLGISDLPDFIIGDAIASGEVEMILKGWHQPEGAVHLVTPPGGPRPARVEVLAEFLAGHFAKAKKRK